MNPAIHSEAGGVCMISIANYCLGIPIALLMRPPELGEHCVLAEKVEEFG